MLLMKQIWKMTSLTKRKRKSKRSPYFRSSSVSERRMKSTLAFLPA